MLADRFVQQAHDLSLSTWSACTLSIGELGTDRSGRAAGQRAEQPGTGAAAVRHGVRSGG